MNQVKKISRNQLYQSEESDHQDGEALILPDIEFEIVEAPQEACDLNSKDDEGKEAGENEEFDFPLFSLGGGTGDNLSENKEDVQETRGRSANKDNNLLRVTLRSPSPDVIDQSRPDSYYFSKYTDQQKQDFAKSAVSGDYVWAQSRKTVQTRGKIIDIKEYNDQIKKEQARMKKLKQTRPGKGKRLIRAQARVLEAERQKIAHERAKSQKLKLKQAKFQKSKVTKKGKANGCKSV